MSFDPLEIFLICAPGLEALLAEEAKVLGFDVFSSQPGGVTINGSWPDVWRANIQLRGATRVLARIAEFRAMHLAQLDKRSRKLPWDQVLRADQPISIEATCRKSKIYHHRAAAQRVERAISETLGAPISKGAAIKVKARIEDDLCTISIDTTGEALHKRGHKQAVNKAPMRETLAALFLRASGYHGQMRIYDPMCGSGTFVIEAAEIAMDLYPGRSRGFAFEKLAGFDPRACEGFKQATPKETDLCFYGSDRDQGAVQMAQKNAANAGVADVTKFHLSPISEATAPDGPPGLIIMNPPYGGRIGNKSALYGLYAAIGTQMQTHFKGWRVGLITSEPGLAKAANLRFDPPGPVIDNSGIKIRLYQAQL